MPPKLQGAFTGHPIKCPSCYETMYVTCSRCKGYGGQFEVQKVAGPTRRTTRAMRRTAGEMQSTDGGVGVNGSAASAGNKK